MMTKEGRQVVEQQNLLREFNHMFEDAAMFERLDNQGKFATLVSATSRKIDDLIFSTVHFSEHINRGVAFHAGISAESARMGVNYNKLMSGAYKEDDAAEIMMQLFAAGHTVAQRTQFVYGTLGRSPLFQSPFGRVAGQFMTYPLKQTEFLVEMLRENPEGFVRFIALTGYWSRHMSNAGLDPTGVVGAGYLPQGVEPGVPILLAPTFGAMYNLLRFSNAHATGDYTQAQRYMKRIRSDALHLMPGGLQLERGFDAMKRYRTYEMTDPVTSALKRKISTREQIYAFMGLRSTEQRLTRELASDMFKAQKLEQYQRSYIVNTLIDYIEEQDAEAEKTGVPYNLEGDDYYKKLIAQARAWGLNISHESVDNAAASREISTYLRTLLRDKKRAVEYWNRYILALPEEAKSLGLEPMEEQ
jgi:hypothetical protein